ncbi:hypothetical protein ACFL1R_12275 [Candidatus Latescibacterota bacterium]
MKVLKITLWICGILCLLGFICAVLPWNAISTLCTWFGVQPPAAEPITIYIIRLCLAVTGLIGVFFIILARNPLKYDGMLLLAAYGLLCYGLFCFVGAILYTLPAWAYVGDIIFSFATGVLILIFRKKAIQANSA